MNYLSKDKTVDWYAGLIREKLDDDLEMTNMLDAIEKMVRPEWNGDFGGLKDVMSYIDTTPSDAINSGSIALSAAEPIVEVSPLHPNVFEYDKVQSQEDILLATLLKADRKGTGSLLFDMANSSLIYNGICVETNDLAHILPKNKKAWTPLQKRAWRGGRFIHKVHNFKKVHWVETTFGVSTIILAEMFDVEEVLKHWSLFENNKTPEGKIANDGLNKLKYALRELDTKEGNAREYKFMQYRVIDDDRIIIGGHLTHHDMSELDNAYAPHFDIIFANQENKYGFLNFSIQVAGNRLEEKPEHKLNPLLAPLYWSKSWDKLNFASSLIFSEPIRRARDPRSMSHTFDGRSPDIDHRNGSNVSLRIGEDYSPHQPFTLDPQGVQLLNDMRAAMNRTTGASILGDTTQVSADTPFATFSAMVKIALSRLDRQRNAIGAAVADVCYQMLEWVEYTKEPIFTYNRNLKPARGTGNLLPVGLKMNIKPGDFDLLAINIEAKVQPSTPTDEQAQIAAAIQLSQQLEVPIAYALEQKLGYKNIGMLHQMWTDEYLERAKNEAEAMKIMERAKLEIQMEAQQAQQQQMQQQMPGGAGAGVQGPQAPPANPMGNTGGAQAMMGALSGAAGGGNLAMAAVPEMSQAAAVTGRTQNEEVIE